MGIQIDVKKIDEDIDTAICKLYTGERCVTILMNGDDYRSLIRDGFFIRDGKELDSANVLNTTDVYEKKIY